jgi:hypothetical protein
VRFLTGVPATTGAVRVRVTWGAKSAGAGIDHYQLDNSVDSAGYVTVPLPTTRSTTVDRGLAPGHQYLYRVRLYDRAGKASKWAMGQDFVLVRIPENSPSVRYTGSWGTASHTAYVGHNARYATAAGATATIRFTGRAVSLVGPMGSTRGAARIYVDGAYVGTVSLYSSSFVPNRVFFARSWATAGAHSVQIRVVGTPGHPMVAFDTAHVIQ